MYKTFQLAALVKKAYTSGIQTVVGHFEQPDKMKSINEDHIAVLISDGNNCLKVDFLPIDKLYENEFLEFCKLLNSPLSITAVLKKFKDFHFLLNSYDHCEIMHAPYQGLPDFNNFHNVRYLLSLKTEELIHFFSIRIKAHRIESMYKIADSAIEKKQLLAYSHRKVGWAADSFKLDDKFKIRFNTNFGYGSNSYFHLVVEYNGITIIPYSEWIVYRKTRILDIKRYTKKYQLKYECWVDAMEDCKNLYNLSVIDENRFIKEYIVDEAKKMIVGLKTIMNYNEFSLFDINKHQVPIKQEGFEIIECRGEKISGALGFISHLRNFIEIKGIAEAIEDLKNMNKELLPILKSEYSLLTEKINKIEPEYLIMEELVEKLYARCKIIRKKREEIDDILHTKYKDNYGKKDRTEEIEKKLTKEIPNWKAEDEEYYHVHNKRFNPLKREIEKLKPSAVAIKKYITDIEDYFSKNK